METVLNSSEKAWTKLERGAPNPGLRVVKHPTAMPPAKPPAVTRKRNRKRKRRAAFSSSSSSSSDDSSSEVGEQVPSLKTVETAAKAKSPSSSSSSSSSESESESGSDVESPTFAHKRPPAIVATTTRSRVSLSPSPPPTILPSFIPSHDEDLEKGRELREKFRKFWMASVADSFRDDLEQIHKEPNMNTTSLSMLIDSLASGADVFTSEKQPKDKGGVDEVEVVLG
ncbi:hypothetical protein AX15_007013 [Amanita polypyramis BW_CC]|nr:hypothetical protein AX15_007013 [Amanita polypyramis BW_CC]